MCSQRGPVSKHQQTRRSSLAIREDITPQTGSMYITLIAQIASIYKMHTPLKSHLSSTHLQVEWGSSYLPLTEVENDPQSSGCPPGALTSVSSRWPGDKPEALAPCSG